MSIINFECLNATTMTVVIPLRGKIYIDLAFPLLKITKITLPVQKRMTKKFKLPYCGIPGAILSANYMGMTRGIIKTRSTKFFRNSITIDVCTSKKNVNAKLSSNTIQMCGPDSEELAREASQHLIDHLYKIQDELDYMNSHLDEANIIVEWIKQTTKGKEYLIDSTSHEIIEMKPEDKINENGILIDADGKPYLITEKLPQLKKVKGSNLYNDMNDKPKTAIRAVKPMLVNEIVIPEEYPDKYPDNIDTRIANFFVSYAPGFAYYEHYCQFMDDILHVEKIIEGPIEIDNILIAMINYSYTLGMNINRANLAKHINGINGLKSSFNNTSDYSVKIELPYEPTEAMKKIRKKYKIPKHTFMVYKSGLVTQSAPNRDFAKHAYYIFRNAVDSIKHKIIQKGKSHNLKYIPIEYTPPIKLNIINNININIENSENINKDPLCKNIENNTENTNKIIKGKYICETIRDTLNESIEDNTENINKIIKGKYICDTIIDALNENIENNTENTIENTENINKIIKGKYICDTIIDALNENIENNTENTIENTENINKIINKIIKGKYICETIRDTLNENTIENTENINKIIKGKYICETIKDTLNESDQNNEGIYELIEDTLNKNENN